MEICCVTQGTETGALWQHSGVGCGGGGWEAQKEGYTYDWFMLMYGRNQHDIAKQLSFN